MVTQWEITSEAFCFSFRFEKIFTIFLQPPHLPYSQGFVESSRLRWREEHELQCQKALYSNSESSNAFWELSKYLWNYTESLAYSFSCMISFFNVSLGPQSPCQNENYIVFTRQNCETSVTEQVLNKISTNRTYYNVAMIMVIWPGVII